MTRRTVVIGDAPRSTAASKHEVSMVCNLRAAASPRTDAEGGVRENQWQQSRLQSIIRMKPMVATPSTTSGIINDALISQPASAEPPVTSGPQRG